MRNRSAPISGPPTDRPLDRRLNLNQHTYSGGERESEQREVVSERIRERESGGKREALESNPIFVSSRQKNGMEAS